MTSVTAQGRRFCVFCLHSRAELIICSTCGSSVKLRNAQTWLKTPPWPFSFWGAVRVRTAMVLGANAGLSIEGTKKALNGYDEKFIDPWMHRAAMFYEAHLWKFL